MFTLFQEIQESTSSMVWFIIGAVFVTLWIVNWSIKRNSQLGQGLFDLIFAAFQVTHVPTGSETGWLARLEGLGDFGQKYEARIAAREAKAAEKAKARSATGDEKSPEDSDNKEDVSDED